MKCGWGGRRRYTGSVSPIVLVAFVAVMVECPPTGAQQGRPDDPDTKAGGAAEPVGSWAPQSPKRLWRRPLDGGYAALAVGEGAVFAIHRVSGGEILSCLDLENGLTAWSRTYPVAPAGRTLADLPRGTGVTALMVAGRLITIGPSANLYCFVENRPHTAWERDLVKDYNCALPEFGYSASLVGHRNSVIVLVGGPDHAVVAFAAADGSVIWESGAFDIGYAAPIITEAGDRSQVAFLSPTEAVGLDPHDGTLLWRHPHDTPALGREALLLAMEDGLLLLSSYGAAGTRMLKLTSTGKRTKVEELWHHEKLYIYPPSAVHVGDYVYGSTGDQAPVSLVAVNSKSGAIAWREPGFPNAHGHYLTGKIVLVDESGLLTVVTPSPEKLIVDSQIKMFEKGAWWNSARTDHRLILRDNETLLAYDLAAGAR